MGYHSPSPKEVNLIHLTSFQGFPGGSVVKNLPANAGDTGSIPELGRSPGGGNGTPLQYSCLGNPMGRGTWQMTVHGVTKSQTWLSNSTATTVHFQSMTGWGLLLQVLVPRHPHPHPLGVKWSEAKDLPVLFMQQRAPTIHQTILCSQHIHVTQPNTQSTALVYSEYFFFHESLINLTSSSSRSHCF